MSADTTNGLVAIPALKARVTDLTNTLTVAQTQQLEVELAALEQRKGSQLVVLIVPTTQPETIEDYSLRIAENWKIGRKSVDGKKVDDGVILLVAKKDHHLRIEVGYGLEGAITDVLAASIIRDYIAPKFRQNDFAGGIQAGTQALSKLIDGEALPPVWQAHQGAQQNHDGNTDAWLQVAFVWFVVVLLRAIGDRLPRLLRGGLCGIAAMGVAGSMAGSLLVVLGLGVAGFVLGMMASSGGALATRSGSGGFGGGGSFSGGGGSFGGGGASGSW